MRSEISFDTACGMLNDAIIRRIIYAFCARLVYPIPRLPIMLESGLLYRSPITFEIIAAIIRKDAFFTKLFF